MRMTKNNGTYALTLFAALIVIAAIGSFGAHASSLSDSSLTFTNTAYNDSGAYQGTSKANAKPVETIICKGTSLIDDFLKLFSCDVVIRSTDSAATTSSKINASIDAAYTAGGGIVSIKEGTYQINGYINPRSNVAVLGVGDATILNLNTSDIVFRATETGIINSEIGNMRITQSSASLGTGIDYVATPSTNVYIHDIFFKDISLKCLRVQDTSFNDNNWHSGMKIERITCTNSSFSIGKVRNSVLRDSQFYEQSPNNNVLGDIGYPEQAQGVKGFLVEGNYFQNINNGSTCVFTNGNNSITLNANTFMCNGTSFNMLSGNLGYTTTATLSNNLFYLIPAGDTAAVQSLQGNSASSLIVSSNQFIGENTSAVSLNVKRGIISRAPAIITNNYFFRPSKSCVSLSTGATNSIIANNVFVECTTVTAADRWLYLLNANDTLISDNQFVSIDGETGALIRVQNTNRTTIINNQFVNLTSVSQYQLDAGTGLNSTYIDRYVFTGQLSGYECTTSPFSAFYERVARNSTTQCTCDGGTWKYCTAV